MGKLYDLFHIIPIDDNCSFVYRDGNGIYKTKSKANVGNKINGDKLIFLEEQEAQNYINRYLNPDQYRVGAFSGNKALYDEARNDTSVSFIDGHCEADKENKIND